MRKTDTMKFRLDDFEKKAFEQAAELSGIAVSAWVRERLRSAAVRELEGVGLKVPFIRNLSMSAANG